jgi:hypothetical protein
MQKKTGEKYSKGSWVKNMATIYPEKVFTSYG